MDAPTVTTLSTSDSVAGSTVNDSDGGDGRAAGHYDGFYAGDASRVNRTRLSSPDRDSDSDDDDELYPDVEDQNNQHDQLPSVEEYKTNMIPGAITAGQDSTGTRSRMDTLEIDGHPSGYGDGNNSNGNNDDGNLLPDVEEYKTGATSTAVKQQAASGCRRRAAIVLLALIFLLAAIIPLAVLVPRNNKDEPNRSAAPLDNDSDSSDDTEAQEPQRAASLPFEDVIQHLVQYSASSETDLRTQGTPQNRAAKWIAETDTLDITMDGDAEHSHFIQRYALAVIYFATSGEKWRYQMNFLDSTSNVCNWHTNFYSISNGQIVYFRLGVHTCLENGAVSRFALPQNRLNGTIPDEIRHLNDVDVLILDWNPALQGKLPDSLGELTEVEVLDFEYCGLTGTIPTALGRLTKLTELGLANNFMTGTVPLEQLTKLNKLYIDDNSFSGDINSFIGKMPDMKYLYLEDNEFDGELGQGLIRHWGKTVEELDISTNDLSGPLPGNLFDADHKMKIIDIHGNNIEGQIPTLQEQNTVLEYLALHDNLIDGFVPESIDKIVNLKHLDLSMNELGGSLPTQIGNLELRYLHTSDNDFTPGPVPEFVSSMVQLRELGMKRNRLTGKIPTWIGALTQLQLLDLDSNDLTGRIPSQIGALRGLDHLLLNRNELSGPVPSEMALLRDLNVIMLDHNNINGTLDFFCNRLVYPGISLFGSDCKAPSPEVTCTCCDICCLKSDPDCNQLEYFVNLDPIREYGYERRVYRYSEDIVPVEDRDD